MVEQQTGSSEQGSWPSGIAAITLFVEDLDATKRFYTEVFGLPVMFENTTTSATSWLQSAGVATELRHLSRDPARRVPVAAAA